MIFEKSIFDVSGKSRNFACLSFSQSIKLSVNSSKNLIIAGNCDRAFMEALGNLLENNIVEVVSIVLLLILEDTDSKV